MDVLEEKEIIQDHLTEILNEFQDKHKVRIQHVFVHHDGKKNEITSVYLNCMPEGKSTYDG